MSHTDDLTDDLGEEDFLDLETEDGIIELTDMLPDDEAGSPGEDPVIELTDVIDSGSGVAAGSTVQEPSSISQEQIEKALESIIEKRFSEMFEKLLVDTVERVVEQEIAKLKNSLLDDLSD